LGKAEALAASLDRPGFSVSAARDAADAAAQADIISCATYAPQPILQGDWLHPGTHVDLVGSYREDMREADDAVVRRAGRLYVDARFSTVGISGDVTAPMKSGVLREEDIADLFQLASGAKPGRRSDQDITVFKSGGGGHEDLAVALALYERAASA
jgi:ornithine cyclodeaminase